MAVLRRIKHDSWRCDQSGVGIWFAGGAIAAWWGKQMHIFELKKR